MFSKRIRTLSVAAGALAVSGLLAGTASAQLSLTTEGSPVTENFAGFTGTGFDTPPAAGQLDSNTWRVTGMSDGDGTFGGTHTTGDFARGSSTGGVVTGGVYHFDAGSADVLGLQPGGSDVTPGDITLRVQNNTGVDLTEVVVSYDIWVYNDQPRANSLNLAFSTDDATYTPVSSADYTTPEVADGSPTWVSVSRSATLSVPVNAGDFVYIQWQTDDISGGGSRDEFGISNVSITGNATGAPPQASVIAAHSFGGDVVATFDLDPGAVVPGDFTLTVDGATVTVSAVSGTGVARTLETATALPVGLGDIDNLAVADTANTDPSNIDFYVYPPISLLADGTIPTGVPTGVIGVVNAKVTTGGGDNDVAYTVQDAAAPYSGLIVRDTVNDPSVGDEVEILAETFVEFSLLRTDALEFSNLGAGTPFAALEISPSDFQFDDDGSVADPFVGILVSFDVPLTNAVDGGFGEWDFAEGVIIDDAFYDYNAGSEVVAGNDYNITGVGYFSFGDYKVQPTGAGDIVEEPGVPPVDASLIDAMPIAADTLRVSFDVEPVPAPVAGDFTLEDSVDGAIAISAVTPIDTTTYDLTHASTEDNLTTDSLTYTAGLGGSVTVLAGLQNDIIAIQQAGEGGPNFATAPLAYNVPVAVRGVVVFDENFREFWISGADGAGGAWNGLMVRGDSNGIFEGAGDIFDAGDVLTVTGVLSERTTGGGSQTGFQGVTPDDLFDIVAGGTIPAPVAVTAADLEATSAPNGLAEQYESVLVTISEALVIQGAPDSFNVFSALATGGAQVDIDDDADFGYSTPSNYSGDFIAGNTITSLTGIVTDLFGTYKVNPRNANDITVSPTANVEDWMLMQH